MGAIAIAFSLVLLPFVAGGCAILLPQAPRVNITAVTAEERQIHFFDSELEKKKTNPLPKNSRLVVVKFYTSHWRDPSYEILDVLPISSEGAELDYPLRFYWWVNLYPITMAAGKAPQRYPAVMSFADGCWPTVDGVDASEITSYIDYKAMEAQGLGSGSSKDIFRLVFYPRAFLYDRWVRESCGLATPPFGDTGEEGILKALIEQDLVRFIESSRKITQADKTMVFRQLLDVIEQEGQFQARSSATTRPTPISEEAVRKLGQALLRTSRKENEKASE